jgi:HEAT repeat protein
MARTSVIVVSLTTLGTLGGLAYVHASRDEPRTAEVARPAAVHAAAETTASAVEAPPAPDVSKPAAPAPQITTDDVARWIADTQSNDAKTRAAAIEALANAPKAKAIPALERVLESGEPQVDRQIALQSLHKLALIDGDSTGQIRDVIRQAIYHSDDEGVTQSAQALLEDIEAALAN